jgi:orotate phosphoribosyltransferase
MTTKSKLPEYKSETIEFIIRKGSFAVTPETPRTLNSKRISPHFLNSAMLNDGESVLQIGRAYGQAILEHIGAENFDVVFGPPYKGIPLATMTAGGLMTGGINKTHASYRKEEKDHGEAEKGESKAQKQKRMIVGKIENGARIVLVDDVITTGTTKVEALEVLDTVADGVDVKGGIILLDRQELNEQGEPAIDKIARENKIRFHAVITISDVLDWLEERATQETDTQRKIILDYLSAWSTPEVRKRYGLYQKALIEGRTLIPALDVGFERAIEIVRQTKGNPKVGGYKIPAISGYDGWAAWMQALRKELGDLDKKLIMDGQKFGNDIPDTGRDIVQAVKKAGCDAIILFPFTGPNTQVAWTGEAIQAGLTVIVGAEMTHPGFLGSEGGTVNDEALLDIYRRAARQGVIHYVFPGNKPKSIKACIELLRNEGVEPIGFSPGFVAQGGKISDAAEAAGNISYHPIVGRGIYGQADMSAAAMELAKGL